MLDQATPPSKKVRAANSILNHASQDNYLGVPAEVFNSTLTAAATIAYTSVSGVFLTQTSQSQSSPVPEPGSLSLMALALVAAGWVWRRRSAR